VLYYISPQVWAWRAKRVRTIARRVDRMAVVFPFEVPFYEEAGVPVSFVGHPLLDVVRASEPREQTLKRYGLDSQVNTVAMLPGSRPREIEYHLPTMLAAAEGLAREMTVQFILVRAGTVEKRLFESVQPRAIAQIPVADRDAYNVLNACDLVWTASGTATLETALMLKPMIVVYRVARMTYALARILVHVKHIALVNIISGEGIVPELIQSDMTPDRMILESKRILSDAVLREKMAKKLSEVKTNLGSPGAAGRVADIALSMMCGKTGCL
jgi:lipid-A-disaccharide synthase